MKRIALLVFSLLGLCALPAGAAPQRIVIAADSTAASYPPERAPQAGWGQVLQSWFDPQDMQVRNHAIGGRSSRSFIDEGRLDAIAGELRPGDILLIQFGHNDAKAEDPRRHTDPDTTYVQALRRYLEVARQHGAIPLLVTPPARLLYDFGSLLDTHGRYTEAMKRLAQVEGVGLIDLNTASMAWVRALGEQGARPYFLFVPEQGKADGTHFSLAGATALACMVVRGWRQIDPAIGARLQRDADCGAVGPETAASRQSPSAAPALATVHAAALPPAGHPGSRIGHADESVVRQPGPHGGPGITVAHDLVPAGEGLGFVLRQRVLEPGAGIGLHPQHKDEVYLILSGQGRYVLDGQSHAVQAGHVLVTRPGSHHALQQQGDAPLVLLVAYPAD